MVIAKPGLDGHDRGAKIIARALRDAGMEVIYTGLHQTPEQIVETAIQEDADAVGVSILSGAHMTLVPRIVDGLKENGADDVLVVVGGTIPPDDADELKAQGWRPSSVRARRRARSSTSCAAPSLCEAILADRPVTTAAFDEYAQVLVAAFRAGFNRIELSRSAVRARSRVDRLGRRARTTTLTSSTFIPDELGSDGPEGGASVGGRPASPIGERRTTPMASPSVSDKVEASSLSASGVLAMTWGAAVWTLAISALAVWRHNEFLSHRFDLGNVVQAVWSSAQGRPLEVTDGTTAEQVSRLAGHADPALLLFVPFWWLHPAPETLIVVQAAALAGRHLPSGAGWP